MIVTETEAHRFQSVQQRVRYLNRALMRRNRKAVEMGRSARVYWEAKGRGLHMIDIGKQIRAQRLRHNMTQEQLAEALSVSAQAVSKWETGAAMPDISVLPALSARFGVTIDELFSLTEETHFARIEAMLESEVQLGREDFDYAMRFLKEHATGGAARGRCLTLLAELCNHRADGYRALAGEYARRALEVEPCKKDNHAALCHAEGGAIADWNVANHHALIAYYQDFVRRHPDYRQGYLWLLDNLIADGRLPEAEQALTRMAAVEQTYHVPLYRGLIAARRGDDDAALADWEAMVRQYPDDWHVWSCRADGLVRMCHYEAAIADYRQAIALQEPPRFTDNYESLAHIAEILGEREIAADAYAHIVEILQQDWSITEGETLEGYRQNIARLRQ